MSIEILRARLLKQKAAEGGVGDDDVGLVDAARVVQKVGATGRSLERSVSRRLADKFGLGEDPAKRRLLYSKLERLVELHGAGVLEVISEVVVEACSARAPGRYFCFAVLRRCRERGFMGAVKKEDATW